MKKVVRTVDEKRQTTQITVADERWYMRPDTDAATGLPIIKAVPSVTWIADYWPNKFLEDWRARQGLDEAEAIKKAAGEKGSVVHKAIEMILSGQEVRIDTKVPDIAKSTEQEPVTRELTYEELVCVQSFIDWRNEANPEVLATETNVFSDIHNYAGTVDFVCRIGGVPYVIDFKTSKNVYRHHELQVSAYRVALENGENPLPEKNPNGTETGKNVDVSGLKAAILQLGYARNKAGYKFTEIDDAFALFKVAQQIWKAEVGDNTPGFTKRDFPIVLSPARNAAAKVEETAAKPTASAPERGIKAKSKSTK
jgi:hypothetical protein